MLPPHQPGDGCLKDCLESCLEDYLEDNFEDRLDSFLENCLERHLGGCLGGQLESYKIYSKPHIYAATRAIHCIDLGTSTRPITFIGKFHQYTVTTNEYYHCGMTLVSCIIYTIRHQIYSITPPIEKPRKRSWVYEIKTSQNHTHHPMFDPHVLLLNTTLVAG
ncbi:hypothetical protein ASPTUDRAFT_419930 [Aspergillus tubingensis CBS 134.48]|uniref:Uncharacterized protein n=1 Tax=Aspergillus tubingensis (strain CBS 134.48) TaxID=767770 RepID=A0A1L9NEG4_ASPTC|nr:hypothetical protein ASPTUDRAFT_419930 [Aspergillus tubingensis CBS 134.48]